MPRSAYAIFCDDLRTEVSGKRIVIGMYGADMLVPSFPYQQPQFVILAIVRCDPTDKPRTLRFEVSGLDEKPFVQEIAQDDLKQLGEMPPKDGAEIASFQAEIRLVGGQFERETDIRVVAYADGEELLAGKLRVRLRSPVEPAKSAQAGKKARRGKKVASPKVVPRANRATRARKPARGRK